MKPSMIEFLYYFHKRQEATTEMELLPYVLRAIWELEKEAPGTAWLWMNSIQQMLTAQALAFIARENEELKKEREKEKSSLKPLIDLFYHLSSYLHRTEKEMSQERENLTVPTPSSSSSPGVLAPNVLTTPITMATPIIRMPMPQPGTIGAPKFTGKIRPLSYVGSNSCVAITGL